MSKAKPKTKIQKTEKKTKHPKTINGNIKKEVARQKNERIIYTYTHE